MNLANGKQVAGEFTGRALCTEDELSMPKIKLYQVWAVRVIWKILKLF